MKKYIISIAAAFLFFLPSIAVAKNSSARTPKPIPTIKTSRQALSIIEEKERRREELRIRIEERLEAKRIQIQERLEEKQATREARFQKLEEKRLTLIKNYFNRMVKRLEAAIARLEKLIQRIESRLVIISQEDTSFDKSAIENELIQAKTLLEDANIELDSAVGNIDEVLNSDSPKDAFIEIRNTIKGIKTKLVEVHRILVHVIGDIKGLRVGNTPDKSAEPSEATASSSPTTSPVVTGTPAPTIEPTATPSPTITPTITPTIEPTPTP